MPVGGDETLIAVAETDDPRHTVVVGQVADQATDDVVETWAQPAAGHDPDPSLGRVEEDLASGSGRLEAGQAADRTSTCPDHAERVIQEHPIVLIDIVLGGLPGGQQRSQRGLDPSLPQDLDRQIQATRNLHQHARARSAAATPVPRPNIAYPDRAVHWVSRATG